MENPVLVLAAALLVLVLLDLAAARYGVDSRPTIDDPTEW